MTELLRNLTELHMPLHRGERLTASSVYDVIGHALAPMRRRAIAIEALRR